MHELPYPSGMSKYYCLCSSARMDLALNNPQRLICHKKTKPTQKCTCKYRVYDRKISKSKQTILIKGKANNFLCIQIKYLRESFFLLYASANCLIYCQQISDISFEKRFHITCFFFFFFLVHHILQNVILPNDRGCVKLSVAIYGFGLYICRKKNLSVETIERNSRKPKVKEGEREGRRKGRKTKVKKGEREERRKGRKTKVKEGEKEGRRKGRKTKVKESEREERRKSMEAKGWRK